MDEEVGDGRSTQPVPEFPRQRPGHDGVLPILFGGKLTINTLAEFQAREDPAEQDKIMRSMLETPTGWSSWEPTPRTAWSISLPVVDSLSRDDESYLRGYCDALVKGGTVVAPREASRLTKPIGWRVGAYGAQDSGSIRTPSNSTRPGSA